MFSRAIEIKYRPEMGVRAQLFSEILKNFQSFPEAATLVCSIKKSVLKNFVYNNSQESTCVKLLRTPILKNICEPLRPFFCIFNFKIE